MANNTGNTSLKGDAALFVPGQREHQSSAPPSTPQTPVGYAPNPLQHHDQQHHLPFGGFQPVHSHYPDHGYYHQQASAFTPWYAAYASYYHPMDTFTGQLREVDGTRIGGGVGHYDRNGRKNEGAGGYARGGAGARSTYKRKGKKGRKQRTEEREGEERTTNGEGEKESEEERQNQGQK